MQKIEYFSAYLRDLGVKTALRRRDRRDRRDTQRRNSMWNESVVFRSRLLNNLTWLFGGMGAFSRSEYGTRAIAGSAHQRACRNAEVGVQTSTGDRCHPRDGLVGSSRWNR